MQTIDKQEGRRKCPACGSTNIKEETDKNDVISHYPLMYGKKYHCLECKLEWKEK